MTIEEYIIQLKGTRDKLQAQEEYEVCQEINDLIESIETKSVKKFMKLSFDIKTMTKVGFFKKGMTCEEMAERVCKFFGYDNVFQYAVKERMFCSYERYANMNYDIIIKVEF